MDGPNVTGAGNPFVPFGEPVEPEEEQDLRSTIGQLIGGAGQPPPPSAPAQPGMGSRILGGVTSALQNYGRPLAATGTAMPLANPSLRSRILSGITTAMQNYGRGTPRPRGLGYGNWNFGR